MAVDPLLEEREREEEERPDEGPVVCHARPDEPERPPRPEKEPEKEPEPEPVICHAPAHPPRPEEEPEEEPVICHAPPVICTARPDEEEVEEEIEIEVEEDVEFEPPAGLQERWEATVGDAAEGEFERLWSELTTVLRACATSRRPLRPPSRRVDDLWHEFILFTRDYHAFCERIGGYVHHVPEVPARA